MKEEQKSRFWIKIFDKIFCLRSKQKLFIRELILILVNVYERKKKKKKKHKRINNNFNLSKRIILQAKLIETREESCLNAVERLFARCAMFSA